MGWKFHPMWVPEWNSVDAYLCCITVNLEKWNFCVMLNCCVLLTGTLTTLKYPD